MCASQKPNIKAVLSNLKKPMSVWKKIELVVKNSAAKILKLQNCCGHQGEPGC
jgi:hypothetical protein